MASVLPFNQISVGATVVASPADFIYGSGTLSLVGEDSANTTADGLIHNYRSALTPSGNAEMRGDKRSVDTAYPAEGNTWPALSGPLTLSLVATRGAEPVVVKTFEGIIAVEYDGETNRSALTISGTESM